MQKIILGELPKLVDNIAGNILSYALILAAVATITMTFLELVKAVFRSRYHFHLRKMRTWLRNEEAFYQLLSLTVADLDATAALFDQSTDKLMAQVQAAANIVLDFPDAYPELYFFFTFSPLNIPNKMSDAEIWKAFITRQDLGTGLDPASPVVQAATRARAMIDHFVARRLDAFQTRTEYLWARKNQFYAVAASAAFLTVLLLYIRVPAVWAVVLSGFGGMMAPLAKDIVSALSGLKTK